MEEIDSAALYVEYLNKQYPHLRPTDIMLAQLLQRFLIANEKEKQ